VLTERRAAENRCSSLGYVDDLRLRALTEGTSEASW